MDRYSVLILEQERSASKSHETASFCDIFKLFLKQRYLLRFCMVSKALGECVPQTEERERNEITFFLKERNAQ